uniref:Ribosomal protein L19 n=1 Tax=Phaeophyceae sp. TaxID=2249243 RepID=A0A8E5BF50_9PHAE|nr:ribosomal protein L19 [Phaeophyceae sp.]
MRMKNSEMELVKIKSNKNLIVSKYQIIPLIEKQYLKKDLPLVCVGDMVNIGTLIMEGNKERIQYYQGIVLAKKNKGINLIISVKKIFQGIGIERNFLLHSPKLKYIKILRSAKVRRSKLYYLRNVLGKKNRLKRKPRKI